MVQELKTPISTPDESSLILHRDICIKLLLRQPLVEPVDVFVMFVEMPLPKSIPINGRDDGAQKTAVSNHNIPKFRV